MNLIEKFLFKVGLKLSPNLRLLKIPVSYLRYYLQRISIIGKFGRPVIIIAMPKSGSTWLENIFMYLYNTKSVMPPQCIVYEQLNHGSHTQRINPNLLNWCKRKSVVIKLHVSYSKSLIKWIKKTDSIFILLHRDISEVVDSHLAYVANTPFHPDYKLTRNHKSRIQLKENFKKEMISWINEWEKNISSDLIISYENLLQNPKKTLEKFLNHHLEHENIQDAIEYNSLDKMKKRSPQKDFYRGSKISNHENK